MAIRHPAGHRGFFRGPAASCGVDACLIGIQRIAIRERILRDYPDSFKGKLIQRERRQRERIGKPFELEFDDTISGRHVSMRVPESREEPEAGMDHNCRLRAGRLS